MHLHEPKNIITLHLHTQTMIYIPSSTWTCNRYPASARIKKYCNLPTTIYYPLHAIDIHCIWMNSSNNRIVWPLGVGAIEALPTGGPVHAHGGLYLFLVKAQGGMLLYYQVVSACRGLWLAMLASGRSRSNMKQCKYMNMLLNLECNQVCRCNRLDSNFKP